MIKRVVDTSFWVDNKVDEFTPEEKYFMLYLLTNPFTTQLGIYEISVKQVAFHLGYSVERVIDLLNTLEKNYGMIRFSSSTNEIAIKNYLKHSIVKGGTPVYDCLIKELKIVKNKELIDWIFTHIKSYENLNLTVRDVIYEYEAKNGALCYDNKKVKDDDNDNDNDNDNDVSLYESLKNYDVNKKAYKKIKTINNFMPPTVEEIREFAESEGLNIDVEKFYNHYEANGWMIGSVKMQNWTAAVRNWALNSSNYNNNRITESVHYSGNYKRKTSIRKVPEFND